MLSTIGYYICIPFSALLRLFYTMTGSYGISLILFTLVIKLVMLPFQMKSKKSMVRMGRMSGRMQEIQKKYAKNQAKLGEEMQKLYAEEGVNPMSGCLWSFIPIPILMALYYIIREPIVYFMNFGGKAAGETVLAAAKVALSSAGIELNTTNAAYEQIYIVNAINSNSSNGIISKFLAGNPSWINVNYNFLGIDLSQIPSQHLSEISTFAWAVIGLLLIPIISGALSFFLSRITMKTQPSAGQQGMTNRMMMWAMPLMSVYIGYILPAALGIYWIAQSGFSIIQESLLGKFYNNKLEAEESARFEAKEAERQERMEAARIKQEEQKKLTAKQQAIAKKKAAKAAQANKSKRPSTNENGRVGDRPYARGRAYSDQHYREGAE